MLRQTFFYFIILSVLTGIIYPAILYFTGMICCNKTIAGDCIYNNNQCVGLKHIGQSFTNKKYFWGRPDIAHSISNHRILISNNLCEAFNDHQKYDYLKKNIQTASVNNTFNHLPIPIDFITHSASGLDPHISIASALYQIKRVSKARNISEENLKKIILEHTEAPKLGFIIYGYVNVLTLNHALDQINPI